jgi:hypothetical protein
MMRMVQVKILGVELEAAFMNPEVVEIYEKGFKKAIERIQAASAIESTAEAIREQCNAVIDYVGEVFGNGSTQKVFGTQTDVLTCLDVLGEMMQVYGRYVIPVLKEKTAAIVLLKNTNLTEDAAKE